MAFLLAVVLPTINEAVPNPNTVQTGDTLRFSAGVTVQPPIGWTIESGARASEPPPGGWPGKAKVVGGATVVNLKVASYTGELKGLLSVLKDQTDALNGEAGFHVAGAPARFTTAQGVPGLLSRFESATTIGVLAVAIRDGIGVEITATGTQTLGRDSVSDVAGILDSISFGGTAR